jgi:hypothetical protein
VDGYFLPGVQGTNDRFAETMPAAFSVMLAAVTPE